MEELKSQEITLERASELLLQAVETQGRDFVYNTNRNPAWMQWQNKCYYTPITSDDPEVPESKRKTGCLIGTWLKLAGFQYDERWETRAAADVCFQLGLQTEVCDYLQRAQEIQDKAMSWGEAYDQAELLRATYGKE